MNLKPSKISFIFILSLLFLITFTFCGCKKDTENLTGQNEQHEQHKQDEEDEQKTNIPDVAKRFGDDLLIPTEEVIEEEFSISIMGKTFSNDNAKDLTVYFTEVEIVTAVEPHIVTYKGYRLSEVFELLGLEPCDIDATASDEYTMIYRKKYVDDPNTMLAIYNNDSTRGGPFIAPCSVEAAPMYIKLLSTIEANK